MPGVSKRPGIKNEGSGLLQGYSSMLLAAPATLYSRRNIANEWAYTSATKKGLPLVALSNYVVNLKLEVVTVHCELALSAYATDNDSVVDSDSTGRSERTLTANRNVRSNRLVRDNDST